MHLAAQLRDPVAITSSDLKLIPPQQPVKQFTGASKVQFLHRRPFMRVHCFNFQLQNICRLRLADPLPQIVQNLAFTFGQALAIAGRAKVRPFLW